MLGVCFPWRKVPKRDARSVKVPENYARSVEGSGKL